VLPAELALAAFVDRGFQEIWYDTERNLDVLVIVRGRIAVRPGFQWCARIWRPARAEISTRFAYARFVHEGNKVRYYRLDLKYTQRAHGPRSAWRRTL
jgi:hypothetical protein